MKIPVADLHCDLLAYLAVHSKRSVMDPQSRCSLPQMKEGHVKLQTLAIFVESNPDSLKQGMAQVEIYKKLPQFYAADFIHFHAGIDPVESQQIVILPAFENASAFSPDGEPIQKGLTRLHALIQEIKPLYISMTWNLENRFGGGSLTPIGLKNDGKRLLEALHQTKVALDLSHASDALAYESIDYIINKGLQIPLIASHSNARVMANYPRNLPDEIAKEIFARKGVVGLNLFKRLVGENEEAILKHLAHWIELGAGKNICFGADFFCAADLPKTSMTYLHGGEPFFETYGDASCYQRLLSFIEKELRLSVQDLAYNTLLAFINEL